MKRYSRTGRRVPTLAFPMATRRCNAPPRASVDSDVYATIYGSRGRSGQRFRIHLCTAAADYYQPASAADVLSALAAVPDDFLRSLRGVYLLGRRQNNRSAPLGRSLRYGSYWQGMIYLHPIPRRLLQGGVERAGVAARHSSSTSIERPTDPPHARFTPEALRRFYLRNVLLHELGHHVDRFQLDPRRHETKRLTAERYADWFAAEQAERMAIS